MFCPEPPLIFVPAFRIAHVVRLPKNYNPNVAPDPERWLPKWQRTGYASKRKRKQSGVGKGTQGSANISQAEAA